MSLTPDGRVLTFVDTDAVVYCVVQCVSFDDRVAWSSVYIVDDGFIGAGLYFTSTVFDTVVWGGSGSAADYYGDIDLFSVKVDDDGSEPKNDVVFYADLFGSDFQ